MNEIIAFCKKCKRFRKYQDTSNHTHNVRAGDSIWEPLVYPLERPEHFFTSDKQYLEYTISRLNRIIEDVIEDE